MVSRKRSEGKARKAAKAEAEAEAEKQSALSSAETREERESLNSRILRLQMENEDVKNGGSRNNLTTAEKCNHGYVPFTKGDVCMEMIVAFLRAHRAAYKCGQNGFAAATTVTFEKYPEVIKDSAKMKLIITHFVAMGTECLLAGNYDDARQIASFARYFEYVNVEYSHCHGRNEGNTANWQNMFEMISADEHTLVKYLRKRIRCHCLEEKYKQVKSITKMGTCMNSRCSLPGRRVERSKMKYCTQCCLANYCSRECQVADWPRHKENCDSYSTCQSSCKAEFTQRHLRLNNQVVEIPLAKKGLFSSPNDTDMLVYFDEFKKQSLGEKDFSYLRKGAAVYQKIIEANGFTRFVLLVAPDKSSTFAPYLKDANRATANLVAELAKDPLLPVPRTDQILAEAIASGKKDVYLSNDSHWGSIGHKLFADTLADHLGAPAQKPE